MTNRKRNEMLVGLFAAALLAIASGQALGHPSDARTLVVTTTEDAGAGSLRAALEQAQALDGPYRITFGDADGLFSTPQTIELESPLPEISGKVSIDGRIDRLLWRAYGATISGGGRHRIFEVASGAELYLNGITISDGRAREGGAILNRGRLIVEGVTLRGNHAERAGGAIANRGGEVFFINSTAADGSAGRGGAIANLGGELTVTHATLYRNEASTGGAIFSDGPLALANSILWGDGGGQCVNAGEQLVRSIHNLFVGDGQGCGTPILEVDPRIGRFGYYNGPTPVFVIEGDSPVINLADNDAAVDHEGRRLVWDQRGNGDPRFAGGYADIGAFERQSQLPSEYVVDTIEDTGLRGCTTVGIANCPLRAAVELALAGRQPAPIRFSPQVFNEPQVLQLSALPENPDRRALVFDGKDAAPVTIFAPGPALPWEGINGVTIEFVSLTAVGRK